MAVGSIEFATFGPAFPDVASFQQRLTSLERQLEADHWVQSGTPVFDPAGFPKKH